MTSPEVGSAYVRLRPNLSTFRAETESGVKSALGTVARTAALALGGVTVVGTIKKVAEAAAQQQKELTSVRRAVQATGASWQIYGTTVEGVLKKQATASGFTVEELAQSFTRVVTATKDTSQSFKILAVAQDIARARNTSVAQAALVLTRATLGSTASLRRFGIVIQPVTAAQDKLRANHEKLVQSGAKFTTQQNAQYKAALAAAKVLDAQASKTDVLSQVQQRFSGQSAAFANTAAGQFARFQRSVTELEVSVGNQLLPVLTSATTALRRYVGELEHSTSFHKAVASTVQAVSGGFSALGSILHFLQPLLSPVVKFLGDIAHFTGAGGILAFVAGVKSIGPAVGIAHAAESKFTSVLAAARGEQQKAAATTGQVASTATAAAGALDAETAALRKLAPDAATAATALNSVADAQARTAATGAAVPTTRLGATAPVTGAIGTSTNELSAVAANVATVQQSFELARPSVTALAQAERGLATTSTGAASFQAKLSSAAALVSGEATKAADALANESVALRGVATAAAAASTAEAAFAAAEAQAAAAGGVSAERLTTLQTALQAQEGLATGGGIASGVQGVSALTDNLQAAADAASTTVTSVAESATTFGDLGVAADSAGHLVDRATTAARKSSDVQRGLVTAGQDAAEEQTGLAVAHQKGSVAANEHAAAITADTRALQRNAAQAQRTAALVSREITPTPSRVGTATPVGAVATAVPTALSLGAQASTASTLAHESQRVARAQREMAADLHSGRLELEQTAGSSARAGVAFSGLTRAVNATGRAFTAIGRGALALVGGWPVILAAAVGAAAFGVYKLITAESALEKQTRRTGEALDVFGADIKSATDLAAQYTSAVSQIKTDRLAVETARLAVAQGQTNLAQTAGATGSLAYKQAVNELAQAQDAYRVSVAQVNQDEKTLDENRKTRAATEARLLDEQGASFTNLSETIKRAQIDEHGFLGRVGRLAAGGFGLADLDRKLGLKAPDFSESFKSARSAADSVETFRKSFEKLADDVRGSNADFAHQISIFATVQSLLHELPSDRQLRILVDTKSAESSIRHLLTVFENFRVPDEFTRNLQHLRLGVRAEDPGLAARIRLVQSYVRVTGQVPRRLVSQIILNSDFPSALGALRKRLETMGPLAHRLGFSTGKQFADAFVLALKQLGLEDSIGKTLLAAAGDPVAAVKDAANAVKSAQSALKQARAQVAAAHERVVDGQQTLDAAVRSLTEANQAVADAIRSGQQQIADAIKGAQTNLTSIGDSLADTIDKFLDAGKKTATGDVKLTAIERAELAKLRAQIAAGQHGPEIERQAQLLQAQLESRGEGDTSTIDKKKASARRRIENLAAEFDSGLINLKKFQTGVKKVLADEGLSFQSVRKREGIAAALSFRGLIQGIFDQARALSRTPGGRKGQGFEPTVTRPTETIQTVQRQIASAQQARDDARLAQQKAIHSLAQDQKQEQEKIANRSAALTKLDSLTAILHHDQEIANHTKNTSVHTATTNALIQSLVSLLKPPPSAGVATNKRGEVTSPVLGAIPQAGGELQAPNVQSQQLTTQQKMERHLRAIQQNTAALRGGNESPGGLRRQSGGMISGPSGTDRIPAMLTAGEMILNAQQQRRLMAMLGTGSVSPERLFGHIAGHHRFERGGIADTPVRGYATGTAVVPPAKRRRPHQWPNPEMYDDLWKWEVERFKRGRPTAGYAHGGVTTGGTALWADSEAQAKAHAWMWAHARPGVSDREKRRTGRMYGQDWMWGQAAGEGSDRYRQHPWWKPHWGQVGHEQRLAQGGVATPFKDLPAEEKKRRILAGYTAGRMTKAQYEAAYKFWHLGPTPLSGVERSLGTRIVQPKHHQNPVRAFGHYLLHGKKGAPRAGLIGAGEDIRDTFNPTTKAGAANLAMSIIGPRGEMHPEDFTGGGGVYKPHAVKGAVERLRGSTRRTTASRDTVFGSLSVGDRFTIPGRDQIYEVTPHAVGPHGSQIPGMALYGKSTGGPPTSEVDLLPYAKVTKLQGGSGPRVPRTGPLAMKNIFSRTGGYTVNSILEGPVWPNVDRPATFLRRMFDQFGRPPLPKLRSGPTRRERAVADAKKISSSLSPFSSAWAGIVKNFPELIAHGRLTNADRGQGVAQIRGKTLDNVIESFPRDVRDHPENIEMFVDAALQFLRGQKPPETAGTHAAKVAGNVVQTLYPNMLTAKAIAASQREGGAPGLNDAIGGYLRTQHRSLFRGDQPRSFFGQAATNKDAVTGLIQEIAESGGRDEFGRKISLENRNLSAGWGHNQDLMRLMALTARKYALGDARGAQNVAKSALATGQWKEGTALKLQELVKALTPGRVQRSRGERTDRAAFLQDLIHNRFAGGGVATKFKDLPDDEKRRRIFAGYTSGRLSGPQEVAALRFWHLKNEAGFQPGPKPTAGGTTRTVLTGIDKAIGSPLGIGIRPSRIPSSLRDLRRRSRRNEPAAMVQLGTLIGTTGGGPHIHGQLPGLGLTAQVLRRRAERRPFLSFGTTDPVSIRPLGRYRGQRQIPFGAASALGMGLISRDVRPATARRFAKRLESFRAPFLREVGEGDEFLTHTGGKERRDRYRETSVYNLMNQLGELIGSTEFEIQSHQPGIAVHQAYLDPSHRTFANLRKLVDPILQTGLPIEASFANDHLAKVFARMVERGRLTTTPNMRSSVEARLAEYEQERQRRTGRVSPPRPRPPLRIAEQTRFAVAELPPGGRYAIEDRVTGRIVRDNVSQLVGQSLVRDADWVAHETAISSRIADQQSARRHGEDEPSGLAADAPQPFQRFTVRPGEDRRWEVFDHQLNIVRRRSGDRETAEMLANRGNRRTTARPGLIDRLRDERGSTNVDTATFGLSHLLRNKPADDLMSQRIRLGRISRDKSWRRPVVSDYKGPPQRGRLSALGHLLSGERGESNVNFASLGLARLFRSFSDREGMVAARRAVAAPRFAQNLGRLERDTGAVAKSDVHHRLLNAYVGNRITREQYERFVGRLPGHLGGGDLTPAAARGPIAKVVADLRRAEGAFVASQIRSAAIDQAVAKQREAYAVGNIDIGQFESRIGLLFSNPRAARRAGLLQHTQGLEKMLTVSYRGKVGTRAERRALNTAIKGLSVPVSGAGAQERLAKALSDQFAAGKITLTELQQALDKVIVKKFAGGGVAFKDLPQTEQRRRVMAGYAAGRTTKAQEEAAFRFWHLGRIPAVSPTRAMTGVEMALGERIVQTETPKRGSGTRGVLRGLDNLIGSPVGIGIKPSEIWKLRGRSKRNDPEAMVALGAIVGGTGGRTGPFEEIPQSAIRLSGPVGHGFNSAHYAQALGRNFIHKEPGGLGGDPDTVASEVLASLIYRRLGIPAAKNAYSGGGGLLLSERLAGQHRSLRSLSPREIKNLEHGYMADLLLGQSDVHAGNLLWRGRRGRAVPQRLDFGATLAGGEGTGDALWPFEEESFLDQIRKLGPQAPLPQTMHRQALRMHSLFPKAEMNRLIGAAPFTPETGTILRNTLFDRLAFLVQHTHKLAHGTGVDAYESRWGFMDARTLARRKVRHRGVGIPEELQSENRYGTGGYVKPMGFMTGGLVPGEGVRDTVPAMLTPGEFVLSRRHLERIGAAAVGKVSPFRDTRGDDIGFDRQIFRYQGEQQIQESRRQTRLLQKISTDQRNIGARPFERVGSKPAPLSGEARRIAEMFAGVDL